MFPGAARPAPPGGEKREEVEERATPSVWESGGLTDRHVSPRKRKELGQKSSNTDLEPFHSQGLPGMVKPAHDL